MLTDSRGLPLTTTEPKARDAYQRALSAFHVYRGDAIAPLDEAIALDPGFAQAHIAKALLLMTFFERRFARQALQALEAGADAIARGTPRERALAAAARRLAEGDWNGAVAALEQVLVDHPRELLALQVAHLMDFLRGDSLNLRNRVSRVLPHWSAAVPGYSFVLGQHAFGLEENNQYPEAEAAGLKALEMAPEDCWAVHAVTHVYEMQARIDEGVDFLESRRGDWATEDNGFAFHNWWHLALFHLDRGEHAKVLEIHDRTLTGPALDVALSRLDATALLWRLWLEGADLGTRFETVADAWEADLEAEGGFYAFNDFHAAMAFAATGRGGAQQRLGKRLAAAASEPGSNAHMTREVGIVLCEAIAAFAAGAHALAAEKILSVRDRAAVFGGSHAQRDVLSLTAIEAARRAGNAALAGHIAAERTVHKPASAWGRRIARRIATAERKARPAAVEAG